MNDLSPQARRVVDLARSADDPDAGTQARLERGLAARLAFGAGAAGTATALSTSATGSTLPVAVKALVALGMTAGLGGGAWLGAEHLNLVAAPSPVASSVRAAPPAARRPASQSALAPTSAPEPDAPSLAASPTAPRAVTIPDRPRPDGDSTAKEALRSELDPLQAETAALRTAQRALRSGDAALALELLDEQDRRFRAGSLQEERAAARVLAQCQAYGPDGVRGAADRFEQRYPQSALLARVRSACRERSAPATQESIRRK